MWQCPECGQDVANISSFCPKCGYSEEQYTGKVSQKIETTKVCVNTKRDKSNMKLVYGIILAALLLLFLVGYFLYTCLL